VAAAARRRRRTAARAHVLAVLPPATSPTPGAMSPTPGAPPSPEPASDRRTVPVQHRGAVPAETTVPAELLAAVRAVCADG